MTLLGANHARALLACFAQTDKLLGEIEALAMPSRSPLARVVDDLTPSQHGEITSHVEYIREQMVRALATLGVGLRAEGNSAKGPIMTRLAFAEIAIWEADPKRLRGYGPIPKVVEVLLERMLADLSRSLRAMRRAFDLDPGKDFGTRLAQLEQIPVDLVMLGKLGRVIGKRGLVELQGLLDALMEQLESGTFEVAVFGRVSSGKSSLLNAVLGLDLLPVGVTPVTAVPTRIVSGDEPVVHVLFASSEAERAFPLAEVGAFVTEAQNQGNQKCVRRVTVTVKSERLPRQIALVDTPGIGSLATTGARETYTYLPRCDLGIVLLDGAGALGADDIRLIQALRDSAILPMLVVSKADLVQPADRQSLAAYLQAEVLKATGLDLPLHWVSSVGPSAQDWFAQEIQPLIDRARENAEASSRRKFAQLHECVVSSLRALRGQMNLHADAQMAVEQAAGEAERTLQKHLTRCDDIVSAVSDLAAPVVTHAAERFVEASEQASAGGVVRAALQLAADDVRGKVRGELLAVRDELNHLLSEMTSALGVERAVGDLQVDLVTMPLVEVPEAIGRFRFVRGGFHVGSIRRRFLDQVVRDLTGSITGALSNFRQLLREWTHETFERLSQQFAAEAGPLRFRFRATVGREDDEVSEELMLLGVNDSLEGKE